MDDIDDFTDDDNEEEVNSLRISRRTPNDATDLHLGLPSFASGKHGLDTFYVSFLFIVWRNVFVSQTFLAKSCLRFETRTE